MPLPAMGAVIPSLGKGAGSLFASPFLQSAGASLLGSSLLQGGQQGAPLPGPMAMPTGMPPGLMGPDQNAGDLLPTEPISPKLVGDPSMLRGDDPLLMGDPAMLRGGDPLLVGDPMNLLSRRGARAPSSAAILMRMLLA